ncbi:MULTISPECIES: hypothetical protein [Rhodococcus]|uniref:Uncharacterized protein n=1 Tax=Rhodococcus opacus RKJ300 = JCM 13270 TaxID=1165867 RepID=I0WLZ6_RHOOP|nr:MULTISPECIES: hypothetical protein [Rhodococcus]EID77412.1 hypothetical protein W59_23720 [Rhodococcus opacus RKJ300 = JCM 13270]QQZ18431.1 hypothetical protein GO592_40325 [Rhodococcus sp. 21391]
MATYRQSEAAQEVAWRLFSGDDNVAAIGIAKVGDEFGLRVNVTEPESDLPDEIDGVPVTVRVVGKISARS